MRRYIHILLTLFVLLCIGCERRPLMDMCNTHYVRVYINENLKNVTEGFYNENNAKPEYNQPDVLRLILADVETGKERAVRFLRDMGKDERGTYYEGWIIADPGRYNLMVYNFDTETTVVNEYNSYFNAKASTNEIATHLRSRIPSRGLNQEEKIVYDPDHLFAATCGEIDVPYVEEVDTLLSHEGDYFVAQSIVKSYYIQVKVKGMEYATSSVGLLSGMSGSSWVNGSGMDEEDNVTIYFELQSGVSPAAGIKRDAATGEAIIYTTFSTFGKLPNAENNLEITFDFLTVYGEPHSETLNITPEFLTTDAINNQWLLLNHVIEIPDPPVTPGQGGGGLKPEVDEWGDVNIGIEI